MSVDLPAPFSPMMPWIVPGITRIEMSLLACTGPKALDMPLSSMAGAVMGSLRNVERPTPGRGEPVAGPSGGPGRHQKFSAGQESSEE